MKSLNFLTNHFNSYYPLDPYIYSVFFVLLENYKTYNYNDLTNNINKIEQLLTRNDINLLIDYAIDIDNEDLISKLFTNITRYITPSIYKNLVMEELYYMELHKPDIDKQNIYKLLQYYFPYESTYMILSYEPYMRHKPKVYYFIRKQLVSTCNTKKDIINKLKYDEQFKFYITQRFYDEDKIITNKKVFESKVYSICNEIIYHIETDDNDIVYDNYEIDFNNYKRFLKNYLKF